MASFGDFCSFRHGITVVVTVDPFTLSEIPILKELRHLDRKKLGGAGGAGGGQGRRICELYATLTPRRKNKTTSLTGVDMSRVPTGVVCWRRHGIVVNVWSQEGLPRFKFQLQSY